MKFALNYSEPAAELLSKNQIQIDLFKVPDWVDLIAQVRERHPLYVHFSLSTGDNSLQTADWTFIQNILTSTDTSHVNIHLNAPRNLDPQKTAEFNQAVEIMLAEVKWVTDRVGSENVVLENCPMFGRDYAFQYPAILPETIQMIVRETGCGFLFDISHARITAHTNGWDEKTYINCLPIHRMQELHITGLKIHDGELTDHFELSPADWTITEWVSQQIGQHRWPEPKIAAFEYGGLGPIFAFRNDPEIIGNQVPRLYALFSNHL